jgi:hypothetical protein
LCAVAGDVLDRRLRSEARAHGRAAQGLLCVAAYGVPVKNYIDQSQEFALRAVALAYPIATLLRAKRVLPAAFVGALFPSFVIDVS